MARIAVISDSHGTFRHLGKARAAYGKIDWLLHAGDHLQDAQRIAENLGVEPMRVRAVVGNCDQPISYPLEDVVEIEGVRLYLTHGHLFGVSQSLQRIRYRAQELEAQVAIFGHTHVALAEEVDGLLLFNPGSLIQSRSAEPPSCGLLEVAGGTVTARHIFLT